MAKIQLVEMGLAAPDENDVRRRRMLMYSSGALETAEDAQQIFVQHPRFKQGLEALDRVFQLAGANLPPQGLVVQGAGGSGCSSLARVFMETLPPSSLFDRSTAAIGIVLTGHPTAGGIVESGLKSIRYAFPTVTPPRIKQKLDVLTEALHQRATRILFVGKSGYLASQRRTYRSDGGWTAATSILRHLMQESHLALVLHGSLSKEHLVSLDEDLATNFPGQAIQLGSFKDDVFWRAFLTSFTKSMSAMDISLLCSHEIASWVHRSTTGSLRTFKFLVTEAVMVAYDERKTVLEPQHLDVAAMRLFREQAIRRPNG